MNNWSSSSYNSVVAAHAEAGEYQEAMQLLLDMPKSVGEYSISPHSDGLCVAMIIKGSRIKTFPIDIF